MEQGEPEARAVEARIRRIEDADLPACAAVFYDSFFALYDAHNLPRIPRSDERMIAIFRHLLKTDPELCWLGEREASGAPARVVGFGMAMARGRTAFLSFLFVDPSAQAGGLGRALFERCLALDGEPRRDGVETLATCIDSIQPISTGLYARYGLLPRVPLFALTGSLRPGALPALPAVVSATPFSELAADARSDARLLDELGRLDREVVGYARPTEHGIWRAAQRQGFLYRHDAAGPPLAYGYAQTSGRLGPVCSRQAELLAPILAHLTSAVRPVEGWATMVAGPTGSVLVPLLQGGMRLDGQPGIYCSNGASPDFDRYIPASFGLL